MGMAYTGFADMGFRRFIFDLWQMQVPAMVQQKLFNALGLSASCDGREPSLRQL